MDWSISKLVRIESGAVSITTNDLKILLSYYGVREGGIVQTLLELAKSSRQRHWASEYRELFSTSYMDFLGYEDEVVRAGHFHPLFVPGLLQTSDYARAILGATAVRRLSADEIETRVRARLERQSRVFDQRKSRDLRVAIDESALRRRIGDDGVMDGQLAHLDKVIEKSQADVIIVPSTIEAHIGLSGPFSLLEFGTDEDPDIVYLDNAHNDLALVEDADTVQRYKATFDRLRRDGAKGEAARHLLAQMRAERE